jgi:uncharacterized protein (TIGR02001 family)
MKQIRYGLALGCLFVAGAAHAESRVSVGVVSDYVWRGISQSDNHAALQGRADYQHSSGVYLGAFASSVDMGRADLLAQFYGGLKAKGGAVAWDIGAIAYRYDESALDFNEFYFGAGIGPYSAKVWRDWDNRNTYLEGNARYDLGSGFALTLHAGHYWGDTVQDYSDIGAGVEKQIANWTVRVAVTDTDISPASNRTNANAAISVSTRF